MCGIAGVIGKPFLDRIEPMTHIMRHRGPDDTGFFIDDDAALGHQRLSIIDLEGGHQPIWNNSETRLIVFNGEIYNHREIRRGLEQKGYRFRTNCDTEVIVHAYDEYGVDCLSLFRGMFAFAIWDRKEKQLFAARDRLGIKPFYYTLQGKSLAFASEIKSILQIPNSAPRLNKKAIHHILQTSANLDQETCIQGIFKLPPGHLLFFSSGNILIRPYWEIPNPQIEHLDVPTWAGKVRAALLKSVERRMISDVPIGATLSGGLDSSSIVALMSELSGRPVKTFTAGYGEGDPELEYSSLIAKTFKTDHTELIITPKKLEEVLPAMVWHLEEPIGQTGLVPLFHAFREASRFVKVVLVGEGADEVFAGYKRYKVLSPRLPLTSSMREEIYRHTYSGAKPVTLLGKLATTLLCQSRTPGSLFLNGVHFNGTVPPAELFSGKEMLNKALRFDQQGIMVEWQLKKIDALSMAHSLEARVPFLDHELVELLMKVPSNMKCHGLTGKYILRKAMSDILPPQIIRRKKFAQIMKSGNELTRSLEYMSDFLLDKESVKKRGLYDPTNIEHLKHRNGRKILSNDESMKLWTLILVEVWARLFLDNPIPAAPPKSVADLIDTKPSLYPLKLEALQ
jgi:asparagine synthase (glutamine-hydrolysing)